VLTVDFFAPLVDSPYDYGAIAAANAMSDVYAMGGEVVLALNVAAFPEDLPADIIGQILRGGAEKVTEAGGVIAGGHTIIDAEPKYGLAVLGLIHPDDPLTKSRARPGDALFLTKPLGTGIVTTAAQRSLAKADDLEAAIASMKTLNRHPSHLVRSLSAGCLTDVTGFGLLGHAYEIAAASGVALRISAAAAPELPGALSYAEAGISTGGEARNREYLTDKVRFLAEVDEARVALLFDPQTSGGLLFCLPKETAGNAQALFQENGLNVWRIGDVRKGSGVEVVA